MNDDKPWKQLGTKDLVQTPFLRLREDQCELPDGRVMPKYFVVEFPDWVNVLPITKNKELVLVNQFRYAAREEFLEMPGGSMDPRLSENIEQGARRELLEETGYEPGQMIYLGYHYPNPALQNNRMHTYVALDCGKTREPELDPFEDIEVTLMPLRQLPRMICEGKITHSLMLASFSQVLAFLFKQFPQDMDSCF